MRQLSIGQLMHAACHANSRQALTPSCRALSRQLLLKACFVLHKTFCRSFLTKTEQHAQTQAPSTQRAGELQRRHRQTVVQQDAQTHRAKAYAKHWNWMVEFADLRQRADLTIHLRLVLQFPAVPSSLVSFSGLAAQRTLTVAAGFGVLMPQRSADGNTGPQVTQVKQGLRATYCKTQAPLDVYTALHQARDHPTELNCRAMPRVPS